MIFSSCTSQLRELSGNNRSFCEIYDEVMTTCDEQTLDGYITVDHHRSQHNPTLFYSSFIYPVLYYILLYYVSCPMFPLIL